MSCVPCPVLCACATESQHTVYYGMEFECCLRETPREYCTCAPAQASPLATHLVPMRSAALAQDWEQLPQPPKPWQARLHPSSSSSAAARCPPPLHFTIRALYGSADNRIRYSYQGYQRWTSFGARIRPLTAQAPTLRCGRTRGGAGTTRAPHTLHMVKTIVLSRKKLYTRMPGICILGI